MNQIATSRGYIGISCDAARIVVTSIQPMKRWSREADIGRRQPLSLPSLTPARAIGVTRLIAYHGPSIHVA
ncbi:MAG TPA: hypothetical protein EYH45_03140 [Candidatus Caldiarchaeum subterraneum]|uniref:Uncharacterized protein n=1 Tax=Caldiarchaeum subterraneum TaxID=311458 RepID=A0A833EBR2_CALS0|nr:hypothetical protein [Candidatus Caldarchaeum subterraneum]